MDSSNLFSHPHPPNVVSSSDTSEGPVEHPTFSDRPEKDATAQRFIVNGLTGSRRSARPVRITLHTSLGRDIDGAWWPHTGSVAAELPALIEALHRQLGEIVDITINWSSTEWAPDLNSMCYGAMVIPGRAPGPNG